MIGNHPAWPATLVRLWLLQRVRAVPARRAMITAAVLAAAYLGYWILYERSASQPDPYFVLDAIPLFAWYALAVVGFAALLRATSQPTPPYSAMLALTLGAAPAPLLLYTVASAHLAPGWFMAAAIAAAAYTLAYLLRALRAATGERQRRAAMMAWLVMGVFIWATDALDVIPDVWIAAASPAAPATDAGEDAEAILFSQAGRIEEALTAMRSRPAAKPQAYFLGFAGVGDEKVFAQEVALASRVLGERYAIDSRVLSLVNDERDLDSAPLATVAGLKYALRGVGARMDKARDILFLAISSHGAPDPLIAVSNSNLPLQDLSSEDLAEALRESGIRWRVIIVSACYAGGFIDSLKSPQTIILTAAAKDRTSFGCSSDRDLTYFGEAFYRDALPDAANLRAAFDAAKRAVGARERAEHETPSDPQAYFGTEMEKRLAPLEPGEK